MASRASLSLALLVLWTLGHVAHEAREARSRDASCSPRAPSTDSRATALLRDLPTAFVPNRGQWEPSAVYRAEFGGLLVTLRKDGLRVCVHDATRSRGVAVGMTFLHAEPGHLVGERRLPGVHHYLLGNDRDRWHRNVPLYAAVRYDQIYDGIDLRAREHDGHFEYDLLLEPHADLSSVQIDVRGVTGLRLDTGGALLLDTELGPIRMTPARSWQDGPAGERLPIEVRYVLLGPRRFGFEAPGRNEDWSLTVDPGLVWSTFVGGFSADRAHALALDDQGQWTIGGSTGSPNFPVTTGAFDTVIGGTQDAFVAKLSSDGSRLLFATYLGGTNGTNSQVLDLAATAAGTLITGGTNERDFPTTAGAFDTTHNGFHDAFVTLLSPAGSSLSYSTLLGGGVDDWGHAIAADAQGRATIVGSTGSSGFPTTAGAYDRTYNGGFSYGGYAPADAFVTRLSATGDNLDFSTFLGGPNVDSGAALVLDDQGAPVIAGRAGDGFPSTPGAYQTSPAGGGSDAYVARLSADGSSLVASTYLGGSNGEWPIALTRDLRGRLVVGGTTFSSDFPTTQGAFDRSFGGGGQPDAFLAALSPTASALAYATYLGGNGMDEITAIALDPTGAPVVVGNTGSSGFPITEGSLLWQFRPTRDAFVTRLDPTVSALTYSTFLGWAGNDDAAALVIDEHGRATAAGSTQSPNFPTTSGSFSPVYNGNGDAYVSQLDLLPTGVVSFGASTAGCEGAVVASVTAMPRIGNANFALTCGRAPPNRAGLLLITGGRRPAGVPVLGAMIWVDPTPWSVALVPTSDAVGAAHVGLPLPNRTGLIGAQLFAQFFWAGPQTPPPCPPLGISASQALQVDLQP